LARKTKKKTVAAEPEEVKEEVSTEPEVLKPKRPAIQAPQGIRTFTIARQHDETGISGVGVVIEGVVLATGQAIIHWLTPAPRGALAIFDSMDDFIKIHIKPHPENASILTWDDGEQERFGNAPLDP
tara:strand:- start:488 stop:868 length:381 start_codon:yes stop_codon:yes gene_type:complete